MVPMVHVLFWNKFLYKPILRTLDFHMYSIIQKNAKYNY